MPHDVLLLIYYFKENINVSFISIHWNRFCHPLLNKMTIVRCTAISEIQRRTENPTV